MQEFEAETAEEWWALASSHLHYISLNNLGLSAYREYCSQWAEPLHQLAIKKFPRYMLTGQSDRNSSSVEVPSSQVCQTDNQDQPSQGSWSVFGSGFGLV